MDKRIEGNIWGHNGLSETEIQLYIIGINGKVVICYLTASCTVTLCLAVSFSLLCLPFTKQSVHSELIQVFKKSRAHLDFAEKQFPDQFINYYYFIMTQQLDTKTCYCTDLIFGIDKSRYFSLQCMFGQSIKHNFACPRSHYYSIIT